MKCISAFRRLAPAVLSALAFAAADAADAWVDDRALCGAAGSGDWQGVGRLFDQQRFSPLADISRHGEWLAVEPQDP